MRSIFKKMSGLLFLLTVLFMFTGPVVVEAACPACGSAVNHGADGSSYYDKSKTGTIYYTFKVLSPNDSVAGTYKTTQKITVNTATRVGGHYTLSRSSTGAYPTGVTWSAWDYTDHDPDCKDHPAGYGSLPHGSCEYVIHDRADLNKPGYKFTQDTTETSQGGVEWLFGYSYGVSRDTNSVGITAKGTAAENQDSSSTYLKIEPIVYNLLYTEGKTYSQEDVTKQLKYDASTNVARNRFGGRKYKITYKANGGKFSNGTSSEKVESQLDFRNWSSGGTQYGPGDTVKNLTTTENEYIKFTAQWDPEEVTPSGEPTRKYYKFDGWELDTEASGYNDNKVRFNNTKEGKCTVNPADDKAVVVFKAKWKPAIGLNYIMTIPTSCSTRATITGTGDAIATGTKARQYIDPKAYYETDKNIVTWVPNWSMKGYHKLDNKWYIDNHTTHPDCAAICTAGNKFNMPDYKDHISKATISHKFRMYYEFVPNTYTVVYNKNQPSNDFDFPVQGTVSNQTATFDKYFNLASGGYSCVGYDLVGWSTIPGTYDQQIAQGAIYTANYDCKSPVASSPQKNFKLGLYCRNLAGWDKHKDGVTLYAMWKPIPYKVVYTKGESGKLSSTSGSPVVTNSANSRFGSTNDPGETYYPVWSKNFNLFNNTPQLAKTRDGNGVPNFTSKGYYIDYWVVKSITGTRETSRDTIGKELDTKTGYKGNNTTSRVNTFKNLCAPIGHDCVVTVEAHWAPIRYKVRYNNDTSVPLTTGVDRGYKYSEDTLTTDYRVFGKEYKIDSFNPTRENKYGKSLFLGYCFANGDMSKTPTYTVKGKSPAEYSNINKTKTKYTATDWSGGTIRLDATSYIWRQSDNTPLILSLKSQVTKKVNDSPHPSVVTNKGASYDTYYNFLNDGEIQSFDLFAVWDDCPGIEPVDTEQFKSQNLCDFEKRTEGIGSLTRSGRDLEYYILMLDGNKNAIWDREDEVQYLQTLRGRDSHYYLDNFDALGMSAITNTSAFELRYTIVDDNGNKYATSRKLYSGFWTDIMNHDVDAFTHN